RHGGVETHRAFDSGRGGADKGRTDAVALRSTVGDGVAGDVVLAVDHQHGPAVEDGSARSAVDVAAGIDEVVTVQIQLAIHVQRAARFDPQRPAATEVYDGGNTRTDGE